MGAGGRVKLAAARLGCAGSTGNGLPSEIGECVVIFGVMLCIGWHL